jgi:hypothetical protein
VEDLKCGLLKEIHARCAAIRSAVVRWPERSDERSQYAKFYSRSHDAVIRVYDEAGNGIETHEHKGDFKEW